MIKIKSVYKSFGEKEVLKDINLNIGDGDFVKFKNVEGMEELNDESR